MKNRLYVGNIPYELTSEDLGKLFEDHGTVESAVVISDRQTGRSRGFGFVEMADDAAAQAALEQVNGSTVGGRSVVVILARARQDSDGQQPND